MRFFSWRYGTFRRIGAELKIGGQDRRIDFSSGWRRFVSDKRLSLPSFPDMDDLLVRELFRPELLGECIAHLRTIPSRDLDEITMRGDEPFDVPVKRPGQILCLVRNYRAHADEMGGEPPAEPLFFSKLPTSLLAHDGTIRLPKAHPGEVHHEVELAAVIGVTARHVAPAAVHDHIAGFTILNDVSHRGLQRRDKAAGMPWTRSKNFATFCPVGPWLVPPDELGPETNLGIRAMVNGDMRQDGTTADLIFDVPTIISTISRYVELRPGDIVATGTPSGVGPLSPGDTVVCEIDGLGQLVSTVAGG